MGRIKAVVEASSETETRRTLTSPLPDRLANTLLLPRCSRDWIAPGAGRPQTTRPVALPRGVSKWGAR